MYATYKFLTSLIMPEGWITGLLLASVLLSLGKSPRCKVWAARLTAAALLLLYALSIRPVSYNLAALLEQMYPPPVGLVERRFDAIVVLGGGVRPSGGTRPVTELGTPSLRRAVCGITYFRQGLASQLLFSGGIGNPFGPAPTEAVEMSRLALDLGVPQAALLVEAQSRTTSENAQQSKLILGSRKEILLVTSALAMPRALRSFQRQGFTVTPAPCDYVAGQLDLHPDSFIPDAHDLVDSRAAIHEFLGLAFYWATGRI